MFKNTSNQIRVISYIIFIIGVLASVYFGFMLFATNWFKALIVLVAGLFLSYTLAIILDALACVLQNTEEIKEKLDK